MPAPTTSREQIRGPQSLDEKQLYSVTATLAPGSTSRATPADVGKSALERFGISSHIETTKMPVYTLTVSRNGPKLKPAGEVEHYTREELLAVQKPPGSRCDPARRIPSLFEAMEEQLGLRVKSSVEEVDVVEIDQIRWAPTSN